MSVHDGNWIEQNKIDTKSEILYKVLNEKKEKIYVKIRKVVT